MRSINIQTLLLLCVLFTIQILFQSWIHIPMISTDDAVKMFWRETFVLCGVFGLFFHCTMIWRYYSIKKETKIAELRGA
jgi:hypothetical protein